MAKATAGHDRISITIWQFEGGGARSALLSRIAIPLTI